MRILVTIRGLGAGSLQNLEGPGLCHQNVNLESSLASTSGDCMAALGTVSTDGDCMATLGTA